MRHVGEPSLHHHRYLLRLWHTLPSTAVFLKVSTVFRLFLYYLISFIWIVMLILYFIYLKTLISGGCAIRKLNRWDWMFILRGAIGDVGSGTQVPDRNLQCAITQISSIGRLFCCMDEFRGLCRLCKEFLFFFLFPDFVMQYNWLSWYWVSECRISFIVKVLKFIRKFLPLWFIFYQTVYNIFGGKRDLG